MIQRIDAPILEGQGDLFLAGNHTYFLGPLVEGYRRLWRFTPTYGLPRQCIAQTPIQDPTDDDLINLLA